MNDNKELIERLETSIALLREAGYSMFVIPSITAAITALRAAPSTPPAPVSLLITDDHLTAPKAANQSNMIAAPAPHAGTVGTPKTDALLALWEDYLGAPSEKIGNADVTDAIENMRDVERELSQTKVAKAIILDRLDDAIAVMNSDTTPPPPSPDAKLGELEAAIQNIVEDYFLANRSWSKATLVQHVLASLTRPAAPSATERKV